MKVYSTFSSPQRRDKMHCSSLLALHFIIYVRCGSFGISLIYNETLESAKTHRNHSDVKMRAYRTFPSPKNRDIVDRNALTNMSSCSNGLLDLHWALGSTCWAWVGAPGWLPGISQIEAHHRFSFFSTFYSLSPRVGRERERE